MYCHEPTTRFVRSKALVQRTATAEDAAAGEPLTSHCWQLANAPILPHPARTLHIDLQTTPWGGIRFAPRDFQPSSAAPPAQSRSRGAVAAVAVLAYHGRNSHWCSRPVVSPFGRQCSGPAHRSEYASRQW